MKLWIITLAFSLATLFAACQPDTPPQPTIQLEIEQITHGPQEHFFGYIGHVQNIPWNGSGRYILAMRVGFHDHMPAAADAADIVLIDTENDYAVRKIEATRRLREYRFDDTPFGNGGVSQTGGAFAGINYGHMARLRPVTGYPEAYDWTGEAMHPEDDGVFAVDVASGEKRLLVSFRQMRDALIERHPRIAETSLFINHTLWNRDGDRLYFYVRGNFGRRDIRINVPMTVRADGSGLTEQTVFIGGHPE